MSALQLPLDLQFRPAYGRNDFLITKSNADAAALIDAWPQAWSGFPALTLWGAGGSGKSHLACVWAQKAQAQILTLEQFSAAPLEDLLNASIHYVIEKLDQAAGDAAQEQKLFHLYNGLKASGRSMLLTSQIPPAQLSFTLADLASRLRAAPAIEIHQPDDALLSYVFAKQLHDRGFSVSEKTIQYAIGRMERSWQAMEKTVAALTSRATATKKGITLLLVREVLGDETPSEDL